MRTSREDVFAAGDCCVVKFNPAKEERYIPLATNAVRMGTLVLRILLSQHLSIWEHKELQELKYMINV